MVSSVIINNRADHELTYQFKMSLENKNISQEKQSVDYFASKDPLKQNHFIDLQLLCHLANPANFVIQSIWLNGKLKVHVKLCSSKKSSK